MKIEWKIIYYLIIVIKSNITANLIIVLREVPWLLEMILDVMYLIKIAYNYSACKILVKASKLIIEDNNLMGQVKLFLLNINARIKVMLDAPMWNSLPYLPSCETASLVLLLPYKLSELYSWLLGYISIGLQLCYWVLVLCSLSCWLFKCLLFFILECLVSSFQVCLSWQGYVVSLLVMCSDIFPKQVFSFRGVGLGWLYL